MRRVAISDVHCHADRRQMRPLIAAGHQRSVHVRLSVRAGDVWCAPVGAVRPIARVVSRMAWPLCRSSAPSRQIFCWLADRHRVGGKDRGWRCRDGAHGDCRCAVVSGKFVPLFKLLLPAQLLLTLFCLLLRNLVECLQELDVLRLTARNTGPGSGNAKTSNC